MPNGLSREATISRIREGFKIGLATELSTLRTFAGEAAGLLSENQLKILCEVSIANRAELYTTEDFWLLVEMGLLVETEGRVRVSFPGSLVATHHFRSCHGNPSQELS